MFHNPQTLQVYYRVPKTASTKWLKANPGFQNDKSTMEATSFGPDHETRREYLMRGMRFHERPVIALIRNPTAWFRSIYKMCRRNEGHWGEYVDAHALKWHTPPLEFAKALLVTPLDWYTDAAGALPPDFTVLRAEDFGPIPPFSGGRNATFKIDDELEALLRAKFKREWRYYPDDDK